MPTAFWCPLILIQALLAGGGGGSLSPFVLGSPSTPHHVVYVHTGAYRAGKPGPLSHLGSCCLSLHHEAGTQCYGTSTCCCTSQPQTLATTSRAMHTEGRGMSHNNERLDVRMGGHISVRFTMDRRRRHHTDTRDGTMCHGPLLVSLAHWNKEDTQKMLCKVDVLRHRIRDPLGFLPMHLHGAQQCPHHVGCGRWM